MELSLRCHVVRIRPEITWLGELAIFDDDSKLVKSLYYMVLDVTRDPYARFPDRLGNRENHENQWIF